MSQQLSSFEIGDRVNAYWELDDKIYAAVVIRTPRGKTCRDGHIAVKFLEGGQWFDIAAQDLTRAEVELDSTSAAIGSVMTEWTAGHKEPEMCMIWSLLSLAYHIEDSDTILSHLMSAEVSVALIAAYQVSHANRDPTFLLHSLQCFANRDCIKHKRKFRRIESSSDSRSSSQSDDDINYDRDSLEEAADMLVVQGKTTTDMYRFRDLWSRLLSSMHKGTATPEHYQELDCMMARSLTTDSTLFLSRNATLSVLREWVTNGIIAVLPLEVRCDQESRLELHTMLNNMVHAKEDRDIFIEQLRKELDLITDNLRGSIPIQQWELLTSSSFDVRFVKRGNPSMGACNMCYKMRHLSFVCEWKCHSMPMCSWKSGSDCVSRVEAARKAKATFEGICIDRNQVHDRWRNMIDEVQDAICI
jgi:hypothetical protein